MKPRIAFLFALTFFFSSMLFAADEIHQPAPLMPPEPLREFRGAWVATVANIDWPSKPGLPIVQQKAELISLLNRAAQLHFNAIIFQVRPASDAIYASPFEPWSEYLTGTQGKMPEPFYDPLAFAIEEAHKRGLELHAWFNPFRARHLQAKSPIALNHISKTHPELVRKYGDELWLDPGEPAAREYVLRVVMDVVNRYDVDGVTFDDYFYPYPVKDSAGHEVDFPDGASWKKFGAQSGLSRDDWRRQNISQFVQNVYQSIKAAKPWVQFGVSPFGIWRPQNPPQIKGFDSYAKLYSDSRQWLANGWVDYLAPQLYWPVASREQSFPALLQWWRAQNVKGRHIWPALNDSAVGENFSTNEISRQIQIAREQLVGGKIHYHLRSILENPALTDSIRAAYAQPTLVPASPWLDSTPPEKPKVSIVEARNGWLVQWGNAGGKPARWWVLQFWINGSWTTQILPVNQTSQGFFNSEAGTVFIRAADRLGNLSAPATIFIPRKNLPQHRRKLVLEGL
jgi:uncharacterized lipoprotein YddW (UPF0748 family)